MKSKPDKHLGAENGGAAGAAGAARRRGVGAGGRRTRSRHRSVDAGLAGAAGTGEVARAKRGRPRAFDAEKALDAALEVFWRKGYEGTSLPDLTKAMAINRPSLYAAFGNKEQLFRRVLDRYESRAA